MKKLGLFGGTFDPLHFGHLNLALELFESQGLDEVLFCPAHLSPFKEATPPVASAEDRYALVERAIEGFPAFRVSPIEIDRGGVSYTIETVKQLLREREDTKIYLLLSEEAAVHFPEWKEAELLVKLVTPLVGSRRGLTPRFSNTPVGRALLEGIVPTRVFEISSTEIRDRLSRGLPCGHLVPGKALDYILEHRVY